MLYTACASRCALACICMSHHNRTIIARIKIAIITYDTSHSSYISCRIIALVRVVPIVPYIPEVFLGIYNAFRTLRYNS